jgi:DNA-binding response OmpR family regulator
MGINKIFILFQKPFMPCLPNGCYSTYTKKFNDIQEVKMLGKIKVLSISRDPILVSFLRCALESDDYEVINTQQSGEHLRDVVVAEGPGFIILDIMMPNLDGIGTCLQIRQWTQIPVMMLSTWNTGNGTVRGLDLCSEGYLTEPFGGEALRTKIEASMKRNIRVPEIMVNLPLSRN